jgi:hypothetical protein
MSKERVGYIIGLLGYTKVCSRWVPLMLTPENKQKRVESCEEHLKRCHEEGDQFLLNIVTGDESWIHHFDPEEKRQSMQYRHASDVCQQDSFDCFLGLTKSLPDRIFGSWEYCQFSSVH